MKYSTARSITVYSLLGALTLTTACSTPITSGSHIWTTGQSALEQRITIQPDQTQIGGLHYRVGPFEDITAPGPSSPFPFIPFLACCSNLPGSETYSASFAPFKDTKGDPLFSNAAIEWLRKREDDKPSWLRTDYVTYCKQHTGEFLDAGFTAEDIVHFARVGMNIARATHYRSQGIDSNTAYHLELFGIGLREYKTFIENEKFPLQCNF